MYAGSVVAVLFYGYKSQCFDNGVSNKLSLGRNKRMHELCRQAMVRITSESLQQRLGWLIFRSTSPRLQPRHWSEHDS
jgi:hypothetical protein